MTESILLFIAKVLGLLIRLLPVHLALAMGRILGFFGYLFDFKHRRQAYRNLKIVFAGEKSSGEIKNIVRDLFKNFGQSLVELFRLPLMNRETFEHFVKIEGKEHIEQSLNQGRGLILLAMHFGCWEMASLTCAMLGYPYKVIVKPQKKFKKLDDMLNSYRSCNGSVVVTRGIGVRDFLKGLKNNEVIGMVVDQGGREGALVPFFERKASLSVGAIRMGLKWDVPVCFSVISRLHGPSHRLIIHPPLELKRTGNLEQDEITGLEKIADLMEQYIREQPSEYMWFYKVWKYTNQATVTVLNDGRMGHLRQSQAVCCCLKNLLSEKGIEPKVQEVDVRFKNKFFSFLINFLSLFPFFIVSSVKTTLFRWSLTPDSFKKLDSLYTDYVISCGTSLTGINNILGRDLKAKKVVVQKPGVLGSKRFDMVILPKHDVWGKNGRRNVVISHGALNMVTPSHLKDQSTSLLEHFPQMKNTMRLKIGVFIGGNAKEVFVSEQQVKILIQQLIEVAKELNAELLITTSRRTPVHLEQLLETRLKNHPSCPVFILANRHNIPDAVGGILGLSNCVIVSGDSISMISEAASSGKNTIVFLPEIRRRWFNDRIKHLRCIEYLSLHGFIISSDVKELGRSIYDVAKSKVTTRRLDDHLVVLEALNRLL